MKIKVTKGSTCIEYESEDEVSSRTYNPAVYEGTRTQDNKSNSLLISTIKAMSDMIIKIENSEYE